MVSIVRTIQVLVKKRIIYTLIQAKRTRNINKKSEGEAVLTREALILFVQDYIADAEDRHKQNFNNIGNANIIPTIKNGLVLLAMRYLPKHVVTNVGSNKVQPKYIKSFCGLHQQCNAYTIELSRRMRACRSSYVDYFYPYYVFEFFSAASIPFKASAT